ncbi:type III-B CRISPR module RAMP protein Cmr6 [Phototrophicus methaneseepsis]|uniref:Type III-B CRISPR module RAMP protein Cmr6 n=1 Tax=Phototrophicus methaneseepsis TaxID=2710758 RepID=A0A7S8E5X8_9CHLR|nr:type III-B CRISPR module RAMP protein Cmr6 [Phototrophicus methaneseepsis]QPC80935.1 type III-B CRISPR module RAMP protein Cmr6 [Phototrophicus methaneseepsis]
MTNQALPQRSRQMLENYVDRCQNLGLILDKYAPWGDDGHGNWDLTMRSTVRRRGQNQVQTLTGGEAKGLWLSTNRRALNNESPSVFEIDRTDTDLLQANIERWGIMVRESDGIAFTMTTAERLVAGLGASHVLETALTLERNTGLPYLPGSTVKGLARAWGLIEIAAQLKVTLDDSIVIGKDEKNLLNVIAETLIAEPTETLFQSIEKLRPVSEDAEALIQWFRFIFGWQGEAGAVCFVDAKYAGERPPRYAADVMTPHYINYYTENGSKPPTDDDNPNPVSFITVERGNMFAFGLIPRLSAFIIFEGEVRENRLITALDVAADWLSKGLAQLGVGSKTSAGYGFFSRKSLNVVIGR